MPPPRNRPPIFAQLAPLLLALALAYGCRSGEPPPPAAVAPPGCQGCHPFPRDAKHPLACGRCHGGDEGGTTAATAHAGLIAHPAHPQRMGESCGPCHPQTTTIGASRHFTLAPEVNAVRQVFGAREPLASLLDIPEVDPPRSGLELADDLLRRRCLRCHPYSPGDAYPATRHGTGCAACHLAYADGHASSHQFLKSPPDQQCLACHYGNFVGADYYGRFEHDYSQEYRTPFTPGRPPPYGLEYHQLAADIHQQRGLACIDCHSGPELMGESESKPSCAGCHLWRPGTVPPQANLSVQDNKLLLTTRHGGVKIAVPRARDAAHATYGQEFACPVCHAQWSFNDQGTHLLRQDFIAYEEWAALTVQGSSEVQEQLQDNLTGDETIAAPTMSDKISGVAKPGIWLQGFGQRRWEEPPLCPDAAGVIQVCRPILDLHLSFRDREHQVVFDSLPRQDAAAGLRPYTPHTIGKAGVFYPDRLRRARMTPPPAAASKEQQP